MKEKTFIQHAHFRNGIEGVPSILRRKYSVDRIPVKGLVRSKRWFSFKIGAINATHALKVYQNKVKVA